MSDETEPKKKPTFHEMLGVPEGTNLVFDLQEEPLEPISKHGYPAKYDHPEQLHSISPGLVRAYERESGELLDVDVRVYYRGEEFVYTMPEERARALFRLPLGPSEPPMSEYRKFVLSLKDA